MTIKIKFLVNIVHFKIMRFTTPPPSFPLKIQKKYIFAEKKTVNWQFSSISLFPSFIYIYCDKNSNELAFIIKITTFQLRKICLESKPFCPISHWSGLLYTPWTACTPTWRKVTTLLQYKYGSLSVTTIILFKP